MGDFKFIYYIIFDVFYCFYFEKNGLGKCKGFPLNNVSYEVVIRISIDLIHAHQYGGNYMLIYLIIFCIFECFFNIFTEKYLTWLYNYIPS